MKTAELNDLLMYDGKLHKVTGIARGKMIIMQPVDGRVEHSTYVLEDSPNFQNGAEPIPTIKDSKP